MTYQVIELEKWERKEHFEHYVNTVPCTYSVTVELDVTRVVAASKKAQIKFYPLMIFSLAKAVNQSEEFRMGMVDKQLVIWDELHPSYTIFHQKQETFSAIWTEYREDWQDFNQQYQNDEIAYGECQPLFAKPLLPDNHFNVSSLPWFSFTGFNLNLPEIGDYLAPSFTMGKYQLDNHRRVMPLSIQVHHAVCDGYHVAQFLERLEKCIAELADQLTN